MQELTTKSTSKIFAFLIVAIDIKNVPRDHVFLDFTLLDEALADLVTQRLEFIFLSPSLTSQTTFLSLKLLLNDSLFSLKYHILFALFASLNSCSVSIQTLEPAIMDDQFNIIVN